MNGASDAGSGTSRTPARVLLSPRRFDVVAKYIYAKWRLRGVKDDWARRLYLAHIEVFNGFVEPDGSGKHGPDRFLATFDALIDDIATRGFDPIQSRLPVSADGEIIDGAHRLAACLAAGCDTETTVVTGVPAYEYDHRWFQDRGLPLQWADAIAFEACRLVTDSFVVVVYPSAAGKDSALEQLIGRRTRIWYRKRIDFTDNGAINLVQQIYRREKWVGNAGNDFKGARDKKSWCFQDPGPVRTYLVESDLGTVRALKDEIRTLYGVGNHSVHINDHHLEALELAGLLFNENSVHMLNARQRTALPWFDALLVPYSEGLAASDATDDCCIDGSGVLAAYGMRDVGDLDFMHDLRSVPPTFVVPQISSHNHEARWYDCSPEAMVHDPTLHFRFNNIKFARLEAVRNMKARRGEPKDRADVALIDGWSESRSRKLAGLMLILSWRSFYQRMRFMKLRLRLWRHRLGI